MGAQYDGLGNYIGYTNDDGTWWSGFGESSVSPTSVRPDLLPQTYQDARQRMQQLNNDPAYKQFTPEQVQQYTNFKGSAADLLAMSSQWSPFEHYGIYNDNVDGNGPQNMWFGPEAGPQHNDTGPEQFQTAWNDMRNGLAIMALPFAAAGGAALVGGEAAGAGAVGAGAAEGGAAATGVDASTGLFAGESATSGAAGVGAAEGTIGGSTGSASLVGTAGSDAAASMPAATAEDPFGGYNIDPNTGDVFHGTGDNPFGSNFSGGTGNEGFSGYQPGFLEQAQAQATSLAKQFGLTPAAALQQVLKAAGRAAPAALGAIGANQQSNSLSALADKYMGFGAPSRARYEASFDPNFTMQNDPGYMDALNQSAKATLHGLSVSGNPAGSPNAWSQSLTDNYQKTAYPALQNFRNTNANAGGIASLQTAAPAAATGAIGAQSNIFNAIGAGANDIFNPPQSLAQQLAEYQRLMKAQGSGAVV